MKIFNDQHEMFRRAVRTFVEKEVEPHVDEWEEAGQIPKSIWPRMGELGFLGVEYDEKYGGGGADIQTTRICTGRAARRSRRNTCPTSAGAGPCAASR